MAAYGPRLGVFATDMTWYSEIGSTNDVALVMAERGAGEGTVVGADLQTAGRGRQGRQWSSPTGAGLYVSVVLRPASGIVPLMTLAAGVAIADGIREASGLTAALKWPNDVYLSGRKAAGILAEAGSSDGGVSHVVLGFGINVSEASYPPDVAERATSLEREVGRPVDRGLVLACCLAALAVRHDQAMTDPRRMLASWRSYAISMLRRPVRCTVGSRIVTGIAEDIDDHGALIVRADAETVRVISGEVIWH
jgi:BirA family biotin operon repressor/biotin-[acetyl-CoA-carboxylase] ligase